MNLWFRFVRFAVSDPLPTFVAIVVDQSADGVSTRFNGHAWNVKAVEA